MNISIINYDIESREADIKFENQNQQFVAYCPFLKNEKALKNPIIEAFLPINQRKIDESENIIKGDSFYAYKLIGKVISIKDNNAVVSVFGIEIIVDDIPQDIKVGDNLYFETKRLDCIL
jgi:hypothetical protein